MIWHDGRVVEPGTVRVDPADRVFEHGLGLFETLRTWDGRAPLLARHLGRLRKSAGELGIDLDGVALPDDGAVASLLGAGGIGGDAMLRITATGGTGSGGPPVVWMTARRLPPPEPLPLAVVTDRHAVSPADGLGSHKSLNYWSRRLAHARAESVGAADCLLGDGAGRLWEASRNNVLFVPKGRPDTLATPDLGGPVVPGIMRRAALDFAAGLGYRVEERPVSIDELPRALAVFLTNSVRGVRPVGRLDGRPLEGVRAPEVSRSLLVDLPKILSLGDLR